MIISILDSDIKDLAAAMIARHGAAAELEAGRRADASQAGGDQKACEAWWRVAAAIRDVLGNAPAGPAH